jgi:hypothetical protein
MGEEKLVLWMIYTLMIVITFLILFGKFSDAYSDKLFVKKYISKDLALLHDTLFITNSDVKITYTPISQKDDFTIDIKNCDIKVYDAQKQNPELFTCAEDKLIQKQDSNLQTSKKIEIEKLGNSLIRTQTEQIPINSK